MWNAVKTALEIKEAAEVVASATQLAEKGIAQQVASDPYYEHMPKNDAVEAVRYASQMGGEDHDNSSCIMA